MKTESAAYACKEKIIINIMDYFEKKEDVFKIEALKLLVELAKYYRIPLNRKKVQFPTKILFRRFILNKEGYSETLLNFYNALLYANK